MPILLPFCELAYFPIPKIACTSLKHTIFEINNGFNLKEEIEAEKKRTGKKGKARCSIHDIYRSIQFSIEGCKFPGDYATFAVIRDPMQRILSAYSNRVLHHGALKRPRVIEHLKERELPLDPDINQFVTRLGQYREASPLIFSHTRPLSYFLGHDLTWFDRIFTIQQMPEVARYLSEKVGREIVIPRLQTGGSKQELEMLTDKAFERLSRFCAADYELTKDYLEKPERHPVT